MTRIGAFVLASLAAATLVTTSAQNRTPPRIPGIDTAGMDLSVRPQDDFFRYVNGTWVDKTPVPGDLSAYGTFAILRDRAQEEVRGILEAEAIKPAAPGSIGQKVGGFYKSFIDEARIESLGVQPLAGELAAIERITAIGDWPAAFARAARAGVRLPLAVGVQQDPRRSD